MRALVLHAVLTLASCLLFAGPEQFTPHQHAILEAKSPPPLRLAIEARAHNALGQDGVPPIERLVITRNTFLRCDGTEPKLIGVRDSRI